MISSVRARLALWHTAVVAVLLVGFAGGAYVFLEAALQRRTDRFLEESAIAFVEDLRAERADEESNAAAIRAALGEFHFRDLSFVAYDAAGRVLGATVAASARGTDGRGLDTAAVRVLAARPGLSTAPDGDGGFRLFSLADTLDGQRLTIVAAQSQHDEAALLQEVGDALAIVIPLVLLAAWAGGYALARRSLAPVSAMSARAGAIAADGLAERLDDRLPVANPRDELGHLASTFNALLDRLGATLAQQREFMSDASHELRTPVAIMRGEADIALGRERSTDEYRDALRVVRDEGRRLSKIVAELFLLARADAGQQPLAREELYLDEVVADCVRVARSLAAARGVSLAFDPPAPDARDYAMRADEALLRRLFLNLIDNAIKHSPAGAAVRVAVERRDAEYTVTVEDTGPGIAPDAQARIFERFFRADRAHARAAASETGGAGLGLSIARWVAEAHGGRLELLRSTPAGSAFVATLPAATAVDAALAAV